MNEGEFRGDEQVRAFVEWCGPLDVEQQNVGWVPVARHKAIESVSAPPRPPECAAPNLAFLPVRLGLKASGHVDSGMKLQTVFGRLVPDYYVSRIREPLISRHTAAWTESCQLMAGWSQELRISALNRDVERLRRACEKVFRWGGERAAASGALQILRSLGDALPAYLLRLEAALELSECVLEAPALGDPEVRHMNAMLTRLHSLFAGDGLPMYESRVAGAIATIVETWRQTTRQGNALSPNLSFPAVGGAGRCVLDRYPGAPAPGTLRCNSPGTPRQWAAAMVRLGWLMKLLLGGSPSPAQMRWLECSLFVAGDDVWGINRISPLQLRTLQPHTGGFAAAGAAPVPPQLLDPDPGMPPSASRQRSTKERHVISTLRSRI
jgi:hypothetical protein